MERFAKSRKILFIEESISTLKNKTKVIKINDNITVIQPKIFTEFYFKELAEIVHNYKNKLSLTNPILWFYSAAFQRIIPYFNSTFIVYDCMDELSAFKNAIKFIQINLYYIKPFNINTMK